MIKNDDIFLTNIRQEDKGFYCEIYTNSQLMKFVVDPLNLESANKSFTAVLIKMSAVPKKLILFIIKSTKNLEKQGVIGLRWNQNDPHAVEIGIIILERYQRQGVGHQAKTLLINHAFNILGVTKIIAVCCSENTAANCANKKLGFKHVDEAISRNSNEIKIIWEKTK